MLINLPNDSLKVRRVIRGRILVSRRGGRGTRETSLVVLRITSDTSVGISGRCIIEI